MPAQDNEKEAVKPQEVLDDTVAHKSKTLLPVLNFVYENQMHKLDDLQEQKAEVQDGIGRSEGKIARLVLDIPEADWTNQVQIIGFSLLLPTVNLLGFLIYSAYRSSKYAILSSKINSLFSIIIILSFGIIQSS
ncbi:MAG: BREX-1 system adenine-specific DNA-methyltransferase PglX [Ruminococcus sp.]|nr:BREX-1 system adenine-specific DNA-methyltransferase PglX [Ruminococcus sp.]